MSELSKLVGEVLASPLGQVIASVGQGVADAQAALDAGSLAQTLEIYSESGDAGIAMLRDIGYRPTFYVLPETTGEVQVSLKMSSGSAQNGGAPAPGRPVLANAAMRSRVYVTPVDAGFRNQFSYDASASAKLTFKIVPVPPPAALDDIRVVPDLVKRTAAEARLVLDTLGLEPRFVDAGGKTVDAPTDAAIVAATAPAASAIVGAGSTVIVTLAG